MLLSSLQLFPLPDTLFPASTCPSDGWPLSVGKCLQEELALCLCKGMQGEQLAPHPIYRCSTRQAVLMGFAWFSGIELWYADGQQTKGLAYRDRALRSQQLIEPSWTLVKLPPCPAPMSSADTPGCYGCGGKSLCWK